MKKILYLLCLVCLVTFVFNGCKYFKKSSPPKVGTLTSDTSKTPADTAVNFVQADNARPATGVTDATPNKYYMIVGCFVVKENAEKYAEKLKGMGYPTEIIPGRDSFMMVAAQSYDNYRESIRDIEKFRNNVNSNAWVHLEK
jgi:hypothetical protein